jgi:hypothetical protein
MALVAMGCGGGSEGASTSDVVDAAGLDAPAPDSGEGDGGGSPDVPTADGTEPDPSPWGYNTCSVETRVGGVEVTLADEYTGINGLILGGVVPSQVPELIGEVDGCRLLKARNLFCDPSCVPGETCGEEGACIPYPKSLSVGVVTITGMKAPQSMEAKWGNHYTNSGSLEHPGFETGMSIHLRAAGDEAEGFELSGHGITKLEIPSGAGKVAVEEGAGLALKWEPGPAVDGVQVHIELNINNHGSSGAYIACEVEDSGSHSIAAALMTSLQEFGVSGFPSLALTRQSADSVDLPIGCVEFLVASERTVSIEVAGVISCTADGQCPPDQSCGADLQCN